MTITPKIRMAVVLGIISLFSLLNQFSLELVLHLLIILGSFFAFEFILWRVRSVPNFLPSATLISAFIIFLLANPTAPLHTLLIATAVAALGKQLIRPEGRHIFNPAALGLLAGSLVGLPVSWWGIGWGYAPLLAVIVGAGYVSIINIRQHLTILSFLATSLIATTFILKNPEAAYGQLFVGSFWFFTLVMLPEPQTTAHTTKTKLLYGALVAILAIAIPYAGVKIDPLLAALLVGNGVSRLIETKIK